MNTNMSDYKKIDCSFTIEIDRNCLRFSNPSSLKVIILISPIPPKRKVKLVGVIMPRTFKIYEYPSNLEAEIDLSSLYFQFEKQEESNNG
jgi:predicted AlkP superfamily phosphohydrolase/phosphomutase